MTNRIVKILWAFLFVVVATWGVLGEGDAGLLAIYLMCLLTIPLGILVYVLGSLAINETSSAWVTPDQTSVILLHTFAFLTGYIQWFVLIPKLFRRMKNEKRPRSWILLLIIFLVSLYGLYFFYIHVFPA